MWKCRGITLFVFALLIEMSFSSDDPTPKKPAKNVLAFGGNGFIGSEVLNALFEDPDEYYSVTLVSRGNWYFDSQARIKPHLNKQILCDREESDLDYCTDLITFIKDVGKIDVVLDFSAYNAGVLETTLELLKDKEVGLYVFISSDSIYEVCRSSITHGLATEEDDKRPETEDEQNVLNENDAYGNDKLMGEELLRGPTNKIPYVIFRLPDVLGARDTTDRWWTYQLWIELYNFIKVPLFIPVENRNLKTSYVYVKDVAQAVLLAMNNPKTWNDVYNLGIEEPVTLKDFFGKMAAALNIQIDYDTGDFNVFPSVSRGGVIVEKAKRILGYKPSSWDRVFQETIPFYKEAFYKHTSERDDAVHQLTRFVIQRHRKGDFLKLIDELTDDRTKTVDDFLLKEGTAADHNRLDEQITPEQLFEEMMTRTEF